MLDGESWRLHFWRISLWVQWVLNICEGSISGPSMDPKFLWIISEKLQRTSQIQLKVASSHISEVF